MGRARRVSETLFEQYLDLHGYEWEHEPDWASPLPRTIVCADEVLSSSSLATQHLQSTHGQAPRLPREMGH
jgi:hypothetical protein